MKKIEIVTSTIFFVAFFASPGNTSEYERGERRQYYEHGERYENRFYGSVQ